MIEEFKMATKSNPNDLTRGELVAHKLAGKHIWVKEGDIYWGNNNQAFQKKYCKICGSKTEDKIDAMNSSYATGTVSSWATYAPSVSVSTSWSGNTGGAGGSYVTASGWGGGAGGSGYVTYTTTTS